VNANWSKLAVAYMGIFLNLAVNRRVHINPSSTVVTVHTATYLNSKAFYFAPHFLLMDLV
jgi:hypothetical protein